MGMITGVRKLLSHRVPAPEAAPETLASVPVREEAAKASAPSVAETVVDSIEISVLTDAIRAAKISRILFIGTPDANRRAGVLLARALAASGSATVLVDMSGDGHAAWDMGVIGRAEDVRTLAASPATFADSIHRDRSSRAHVMAACLAKGEAGGAASEAAKAVFAALAQAYARSVVVFDDIDIDFDLLGDIVDDNTALVLPQGDEAARGDFDLRRRLAELGIGEPVVLLLPVPIEGRKAA